MMTPRTTACLLAFLLVGCAAHLAQAPASKPHGLLHVRIVHPDDDSVYDTQAKLDAQALVPLDGEKTVRLSPGSHQLALIVTERRYVLGTEDVYRPNAGACIGPTCNVRAPQTAHQLALVEGPRAQCKQTLKLQVDAGSELVALVVMAADRTCTSCVVSGKSAHSCP